MIKVKRVEVREDFPNRDEAYAILCGADGRFAFAWGPKYPYEDEVPTKNVPAGESGLEWFDSEDEARAAMNRAVEAWSDVRGGK